MIKRPRLDHEKADRAVTERVFQCKTCSRRFATFQALGGHRASHRKPNKVPEEAAKAKLHECSVCGLEFAVGQALGGHMKRHRQAEAEKKRGDERKRLMWMDLNLTPMENDLVMRKMVTIGDWVPIIRRCYHY